MKDPRPLPRAPDRYDRLWAGDLVRKLEDFFASLKLNITLAGVLTTLSGRVKKVTLVTSASYTAVYADHIIDVNFAGTVTITLPTGTKGREFIVQDSSGAASSNNITVTPANAAAATLATDYGRLKAVHNGTIYVAA